MMLLESTLNNDEELKLNNFSDTEEDILSKLNNTNMNKKIDTLEAKEIDLLNRKNQIMKMLSDMKGVDLRDEDDSFGGGDQDSSS